MKTGKACFSLKMLLAGLAVLGCLAWVPAGVGAFRPVDSAGKAGATAVPFLILGDPGEGGSIQRSVAAALLDCFARDGAAAVLLLGDNFLPRGVQSIVDPLWKERFENMYPAARIDVPFCAVLGNHDCLGVPDAQIDYTRTLLNGKPTRWYLPKPGYWTRLFRSADGALTVRVVGLNTMALIQSPENDIRVRQQLEWLEKTLAQSVAAGETWRVVTGHHPMYSSGMHGWDKGLERLLAGRLQAGDVSLYLSGHDHHFEIFPPVRGLAQVVAGGGGKPRGAEAAGNSILFADVSGFGWMCAQADGIVMRFVDRNGRVLGAWKAPRVPFSPAR